MNEVYKVKFINDNVLNVLGIENIFKGITGFQIIHYPWDVNGYKPEVEVKLFYTTEHLHIRFKSYETQIKAEYNMDHDPVCKDSCVECFINPNPEHSHDYFNFEVNPIGTLKLAVGKERNNRKTVDVAKTLLFMEHSVSECERNNYNNIYWTVSYAIPFSLLERNNNKLEVKSGHKMRANFYKCGDDTIMPHFGCWNRINCDQPDFHQPEYFGELILE